MRAKDLSAYAIYAFRERPGEIALPALLLDAQPWVNDERAKRFFQPLVSPMLTTENQRRFREPSGLPVLLAKHDEGQPYGVGPTAHDTLAEIRENLRRARSTVGRKPFSFAEYLQRTCQDPPMRCALALAIPRQLGPIWPAYAASVAKAIVEDRRKERARHEALIARKRVVLALEDRQKTLLDTLEIVLGERPRASFFVDDGADGPVARSNVTLTFDQFERLIAHYERKDRPVATPADSDLRGAR